MLISTHIHANKKLPLWKIIKNIQIILIGSSINTYNLLHCSTRMGLSCPQLFRAFTFHWLLLFFNGMEVIWGLEKQIPRGSKRESARAKWTSHNPSERTKTSKTDCFISCHAFPFASSSAHLYRSIHFIMYLTPPFATWSTSSLPRMREIIESLWGTPRGVTGLFSTTHCDGVHILWLWTPPQCVVKRGLRHHTAVL